MSNAEDQIPNRATNMKEFSEMVKSTQDWSANEQYTKNISTSALLNSQAVQGDIMMDNKTAFEFYEEYKKVYRISHNISMQKLKEVELIEDLLERLQNIEEKTKYNIKPEPSPQRAMDLSDKLKRSRRTAEQIERKFRCQVEFCERCYGSQGSLQQHIKIKHPKLYKLKYSESSYQESSNS